MPYIPYVCHDRLIKAYEFTSKFSPMRSWIILKNFGNCIVQYRSKIGLEREKRLTIYIFQSSFCLRLGGGI